MENMATELGSVAPVRCKEFPWDNDASDKCGSDKCGSDECGTVQVHATNVQKTSSDDAPVTTVQATNAEAMAVDPGVDVTESRTIQTEHTTTTFKKRKVPYLKPSPPSTPPPVPLSLCVHHFHAKSFDAIVFEIGADLFVSIVNRHAM